MAFRVLSRRILDNIHCSTAMKPRNTCHTSLSTATVSSSSPATTLNLEDVEQLFGSVSTKQLLRSSAIQHAMAVDSLVDLGIWVTKVKVFESGMLRDLVTTTMRHTLYANYCAGEDAAAAGRSILALNDTGLRSMLAFGAEDALDNEGCDENLQGFLHSVEVTKSLPPSSVSVFICRPTATLHYYN